MKKIKMTTTIIMILFLFGCQSKHKSTKLEFVDTIKNKVPIALEPTKQISFIEKLYGVPLHKRYIIEDNSFICFLPPNRVIYGTINTDNNVYTPDNDHTGTFKIVGDDIIEIKEVIQGEKTIEIGNDENGVEQAYWKKGKSETYKFRYKYQSETYMGSELVTLTLMYDNGKLFTDSYSIYDVNLTSMPAILKDYK